MNLLRVGEKIGDYSILGFLGAGGMGEVYQGVHTKINRLAAIKVLYHRADNTTFITRFFNEARLQSSLQHPNIAALYDFQEINRQLYIFMEFADGESLEELIKRRAFTIEDALKTFLSICEAVAFIHRHGIIHRDIKAQNIKLTSIGTVKLLDFGIAKDSASQRLTKEGGIIGTPNYLAPEQLAGKEASPQTDIWALGVLFYEMLTGSEPFKANTFGELYSQITTGSFELPEKLNPAVPPAVSQIITKCLEKNLASRYRTVDEILKSLQSVLRREKSPSVFSLKRFIGFAPKKSSETAAGNNYQIQSLDYDTPQPTPTLKKKSPFAVVIIASALAVLLLFGAIGFVIWSMGSSDSNSNTVAIKKTITPLPVVSKPTNPIGAQSATNANSIGRQSATNANLIKVRVETNEGSAQVFRDAQIVGNTPFDVIGSEGETVKLTLKREGFEDQVVSIDITGRRGVFTFSLKRKQ